MITQDKIEINDKNKATLSGINHALVNESSKRKRRRILAIMVAVIILLLWAGSALWSIGPGKTKAFRGVDQAVNDVRPWQFGTVLYDNSITPTSDQPPERYFIVQVNNSPSGTNTGVAQALKNVGFNETSSIPASESGGGIWQRNKNGKFVVVFVQIEAPGDTYGLPNNPSDTVGSDQAGLKMSFDYGN